MQLQMVASLCIKVSPFISSLCSKLTYENVTVSCKYEMFFTSSSPVTIVLNVYDIIHPHNSSLSAIGIGIHHTGIEINNYEYSFGSSAGIVRTRPRLPEFGALREQITMGVYANGMYGVDSIISELRNNRFHMSNYNLTSLNCNHFSDAFCMATLNAHIPAWINRAANIGSHLSFLSNTASSGTASRGVTADTVGGFKAPGVVNPPELHNLGSTKSMGTEHSAGHGAPASTETSLSIFSWFGWGSRQEQVDPVSVPHVTAAVKSTLSAKKPLTEQQQRMIAKLKQKG